MMCIVPPVCVSNLVKRLDLGAHAPHSVEMQPVNYSAIVTSDFGHLACSRKARLYLSWTDDSQPSPWQAVCSTVGFPVGAFLFLLRKVRHRLHAYSQI